MRRGGLSCAAALALAAFWPAASASGAEQTLALYAASTEIRFTLGATLHSVEGTLRLAEGALRFDAGSGAASGEVVLDATSASTGLAMRDRVLHREVLESGEHPRIVFRAGRLRVLRRAADDAEVELDGRLELHGTERPLSIPARVSTSGGRVAIEARIRVDWVDYGLHDPSTFLLRVDPFVDVAIHSEGRLDPPDRDPAAPPDPGRR